MHEVGVSAGCQKWLGWMVDERSDSALSAVWGAQEGQADEIGRSTRSVRRYRMEAEAAGLIRTIRDTPKPMSFYPLHPGGGVPSRSWTTGRGVTVGRLSNRYEFCFPKKVDARARLADHRAACQRQRDRWRQAARQRAFVAKLREEPPRPTIGAVRSDASSPGRPGHHRSATSRAPPAVGDAPDDETPAEAVTVRQHIAEQRRKLDKARPR